MLSELAFPHIRCCLSAIPSDLMKSTVVDESLSSMNQQFCSRETNFYKCYNRMRNLHKFILENYGIGSLRLLKEWEKFQLRQCNFKNHRIFTLRCIHSELVPVSIRLKSTLKSERAKKILRTAEKQLLQTRLKSINSLLDNNAKQLELTRSKIASISTPPNYQECQEFIEKIKEKRFIKVRERQVRKLNNLINKKEGNITGQSSQVPLATRASPWATTGRQVTVFRQVTAFRQAG